MFASSHRRPDGFSLIEVLVVVSIIGLLMGMLLPSLRGARDQAKLAVCAANLNQVGIAIHVYANDYEGCLPRGPEPSHPYDFGANTLATNQLWIGADAPATPTDHPQEYNGLGRLLATIMPQPKVFFCPADDNCNLQEEAPKIGTDDSAYGSYLYRQLDHLPPSAAAGRLDHLGVNRIGERLVRVEALALDTNSLGPGLYYHTNHRARKVNILFRDASVRTFGNDDNIFALTPDVFDNPVRIPSAIDQILTRADYAYGGSPSEAPQIDSH